MEIWYIFLQRFEKGNCKEVTCGNDNRSILLYKESPSSIGLMRDAKFFLLYFVTCL